MTAVARIDDQGWTLEIERGWLDPDGLRPALELPLPTRPQLVDELPPGEYDLGVLRVSVAAPGETEPSVLVVLGYHRLDGDFGAGAILVPETGRLFVAGGSWAICYHRDGERWVREWEHEVHVMAWGLVRHGDWIVLSGELELVAWDLDGVRRLTAAVEPPWSYEIHDGQVRLDIDGVVTMVPLP